MRAILISIKPRHCANTLNGDKKIEVRTTTTKEWKNYLSGKTNVMPEPIDVYIYCTKNGELLLHELKTNSYFVEPESEHYRPNYGLNGKVVAKFTLNKVEEIKFFKEFVCPSGYENYDGEWVNTSETYENVHYINNGALQKTCLSYEELQNYLGNKNGYAWHISNLEIFGKPKELSEFRKYIGIPHAYSDSIINAFRKLFNDKTIPLTNQLTKAPKSWQFIEVGEQNGKIK